MTRAQVSKPLSSSFRHFPFIAAVNCRAGPSGLQTEPDNSSDSSKTAENWFVEYGHWLLSLGILYAANKGLAKATAASGIAFPSPLIGRL